MAQMNYLLTKIYEARAHLGRRNVSTCGSQGLAGWRGEEPAQIVEYLRVREAGTQTGPLFTLSGSIPTRILPIPGDIAQADPTLLEGLTRGLATGPYAHLWIEVGQVALDGCLREL